MGLEICYDLRFPEVARSLALQDADFLVTVAQFPAQREEQWRALSLARAIENQIPHLACNWAEGGGSMIISARALCWQRRRAAKRSYSARSIYPRGTRYEVRSPAFPTAGPRCIEVMA